MVAVVWGRWYRRSFEREVEKAFRRKRRPAIGRGFCGSEPALAILERLRAQQDVDLDCVFLSRVGGTLSWMGKTTRQIQEVVGFHFTPHDLRRTCATNLSELGIDDTIIARILNHSWVDQNVTARVYNRFQKLPEMQRALARWGARLEQIVTGEPAKVLKMR